MGMLPTGKFSPGDLRILSGSNHGDSVIFSSILRPQALILFLILLVGCDRRPYASPASPKSVNVFAAASLTEAFTEIGNQFRAANPDIVVNFNFAGSQQLLAQIENGAPADVFASADQKEMNRALSESLVLKSTLQNFAANHLVVIFPHSNPATITTLADLARPGLKIDLADPSVPAGKYSREVLASLADDPRFGPAFEKAVLANVVSWENNVKAVVSKIMLGEADAGMVYVTDVTPAAARQISTLEIPAKFNAMAVYPVALLVKSSQPSQASRFEDFLLSEGGQSVMRRYKFLPASAENR